MGGSNSPAGDRSPFAHQVAALTARLRREDQELIGTFRCTRRFKVQGDEKPTHRSGRGKALILHGGKVVDFGRVSPLSSKPRQDGSSRVPHFDIKVLGPQHLPTKNGKVSKHCKTRTQSSADHIDYVREGSDLTLAKHLGYIRRVAAVEDREAGLIIDVLDEIEIRSSKNAMAVWSNIPGGRERERSLFEAAERCESKPKVHELTASTASLRHLAWLAMQLDAPAGLSGMVDALAKKFKIVAAKAGEAGKAIEHITTPIATVTSEEAYNWLEFFADRATKPEHRVEFKQGRTGTVQMRLVGELPHGLSATDRFKVLDGLCKILSNYGYMVVAAIHQPDPHTSTRNFHFHIDAYPRPSKWLDEHDCWDFEHPVLKRGKITYPSRQKKVRHNEVDAEGKPQKPNVARLMRDHYLDVIERVTAGRSDVTHYLRGTYAENDIERTPLKHMGNRAIAMEKRGVETPVGNDNARTIFADKFARIDREMQRAEAALEKELALLRQHRPFDDTAAKRIDRYEALQVQLITRDAEAAARDVIEIMARSRAEAVVVELRGTVDEPKKVKTTDAKLLDAGLAHLQWADRISCSGNKNPKTDRRGKDLGTQAEQLWAEIGFDLTEKPPADRLVFVSCRADRQLGQINPLFAGKMRERLARWLTMYGNNPAKLTFSGREVRLATSVPMSIDTLMRRFAAEPQIQSILRSAHRASGRAADAGSKWNVVSQVSPEFTAEFVRRILSGENYVQQINPQAAAGQEPTPAMQEKQYVDRQRDLADLRVAEACRRQVSKSARQAATKRPASADLPGLRALSGIDVAGSRSTTTRILRDPARDGLRRSGTTADPALRGPASSTREVGERANGSPRLRDGPIGRSLDRPEGLSLADLAAWNKGSLGR